MLSVTKLRLVKGKCFPKYGSRRLYPDSGYYCCLSWLQEGASAGSVIFSPQEPAAANKIKLDNHNMTVPLLPFKVMASVVYYCGILHDNNCFTVFWETLEVLNNQRVTDSYISSGI